MTENEPQPFSEDAALRALEDLQRQIEQSRARRKDANEAFDRFLRAFDRRPVEPAVPDLPAPEDTVVVAATAPLPHPTDAPLEPGTDDTLIAAPLRAPVESPTLIRPPADLPSHAAADVEPDEPDEPTMLTRSEPRTTEVLEANTLDGWDHRAHPSAATAAFHSESDIQAMAAAVAAADAMAPDLVPPEPRAVPAALRAPAPQRPRRLSPMVALLLLAVAGSAIFIVWRARGRDAQASTEPAAAAASAPPRAIEAPTASAAPVAAATPTAVVSTVRKVWVRVLVDGKKVLEQELPPDTRIPLTPTSQVIVRAGDAGAVRVAIAGKDQGPVGRDGEVATRQFKVATPPGPPVK